MIEWAGDKKKSPVFLAGSFNADPDSATMTKMKENDKFIDLYSMLKGPDRHPNFTVVYNRVESKKG